MPGRVVELYNAFGQAASTMSHYCLIFKNSLVGFFRAVPLKNESEFLGSNPSDFVYTKEKFKAPLCKPC